MQVVDKSVRFAKIVDIRRWCLLLRGKREGPGRAVMGLPSLSQGVALFRSALLSCARAGGAILMNFPAAFEKPKAGLLFTP